MSFTTGVFDRDEEDDDEDDDKKSKSGECPYNCFGKLDYICIYRHSITVLLGIMVI